MLRKLLLIVLFFTLFIGVKTNAQVTPPCTPENPCPPPPRSIDGGLLVLLAIGVTYGVKRLKRED